jgi:hypothetical protein
MNSNEDVRYRLYAVLVHEGFSTCSGHYYCYVKNSNDVWFCMNDSDVRQVPEKAILNQTPYLLFYERVINYQTKYSIDTHIRRLKNESSSKDINGNGSESTTTTDSDSIEKLEEKNEIKPKIKNIELKENTVNIKRDNSFTSGLVRSNSSVSDFDNMLTKSVSLNFFINSNDVPRFVSKNMKRLLKLKRLQTSSSVENKRKSACIISNEEKEEVFLKPFPKTDKEEVKLKKESFVPQFEKENNSSNDNNYIMKKKIKELYGSGNISLWDDNNNDALKKQYCFIKKEKLDKENAVLKKDQYDIDYDRGRTKKIKKKVAPRKTNVFQKTQNRNNLSRKIH